METLNKVLEGKEYVCGKVSLYIYSFKLQFHNRLHISDFQISVADFLFYEALYCWRELDPELISAYSNLEKYMERFEVSKQYHIFTLVLLSYFVSWFCI